MPQIPVRKQRARAPARGGRGGADGGTRGHGAFDPVPKRALIDVGPKRAAATPPFSPEKAAPLQGKRDKGGEIAPNLRARRGRSRARPTREEFVGELRGGVHVGSTRHGRGCADVAPAHHPLEVRRDQVVLRIAHAAAVPVDVGLAGAGARDPDGVGGRACHVGGRDEAGLRGLIVDEPARGGGAAEGCTIPGPAGPAMAAPAGDEVPGAAEGGDGTGADVDPSAATPSMWPTSVSNLLKM